MPEKVWVERPERCIGCYSCVYACSRELFGTTSATRAAIFVRTGKSLEERFHVVVCIACKNPPCAAACKKEALQAKPEGGVTLVASKCVDCKNFECLSACAIGALTLDPKTRKPIICTECGLCAKYCPHEVLGFGEAGGP
ncbi:[Fe-S]-binding protein [Candidatus Bathyarchaeota archaeon]|nr:[Fe-S]-binding protein [Candidatus Bathyarchaeota archaeon]